MTDLPMTYGVEAGMTVPEFYIIVCPYCKEEIVGSSLEEVNKLFWEHIKEKHPTEIPTKWEVRKWSPRLPGDADEW